MALVNPVVQALPAGETVYEEGCLSFPGIRGDVERPDAISVAFRDPLGGSHTLLCTGLLSRCIQHEVDHLNGVLFIDRMEKKIRASLADGIKALAMETRTKGAKP
jgi:peptide deformylase